MSHSNSSLNCFTNCMARYNLAYIKRVQPCKPPSPHLTFGTMAHDVLYKAGALRDEVNEGVVDKDAYYSIIPSEVLYGDLKTEFGIPNWNNYFRPVIKQVAKYEEKLVKELLEYGNVTIQREVKLSITPEELAYLGYPGIEEPLVGIIDLLLMTDTHAYILDYKFSSSRKTQDDFDMNSQLPLYALFVNFRYDIPIHNIAYGYIDIPKQSLESPVVLKNGTLSRSKSQNVTQELYEKAVIAVHGDDPYYNCQPDGYYYECWCNMAFNKPAYLSMQWLDMDVYVNVVNDVLKTAQLIELMKSTNQPFLRKYDAYSCKGCDYLQVCKPWLTAGGEE